MGRKINKIKLFINDNEKSTIVAKDLEIYVNPNARKEWDWCKVYPKTNKKIYYNEQI